MKEKEIKRVKYSKIFLRSSGKLPERVIHQAEEKEIVFKEDAFHPALKTHKLNGEEKETWAFWINYK